MKGKKAILLLLSVLLLAGRAFCAEPQFRLTAESKTGTSEVTVQVGGEDLERVCGFSFLLRYDPTALQYEGMDASEKLQNATVSDNGRFADDTVKIVCGSAEELTLSGTLLTLRFTALFGGKTVTLEAEDIKTASADGEKQEYPPVSAELSLPKTAAPTQDSSYTPAPSGSSAASEKETAQNEQKRFSDVAQTAWYAESVRYVTEKGLMNGTSQTEFSPETAMTRGMLMTVLARYAGVDTGGSTPWYEKGLQWAKEKAISDGSDPTGIMTREQLVTMLYRYAGKPEAKGDLTAFRDADAVSSYAVAAMKWAIAEGIISGMGNAAIAPQGSATRAQVATILMRFCENYNADTDRATKIM